jgi:hypothetical protein
MPSPFPGMDPYLENSVLWSGLHQLLIARILIALNSTLPQKYVANIAERVYVLQTGRDIYPDVAVLEHPFPGSAGESQGGGVAVAPVGDPPLVLEVEAVEVHEPFIEILPVADQSRVVTIIEVLSPTNKEGGTGRELYLTKQREALRSQAHFLEIDLLRGGQHTVAAPLNHLLLRGSWHSVVCLHRTRQGTRFEVWPIPLEQRLPRVRVPLGGDDPDASLDLQELFSRCYDEAAYQRRISYQAEPPVRLSPSTAQWADVLLRERGLRTEPTGDRP